MQFQFDVEKIMRLCIKEALKAKSTFPNPKVGAALVNQKGKVLKLGYHKKVGSKHAEVEVLQDIEYANANDILFCTLEPCNHHGKTPPCTELIIKKKIKKVVIGSLDPNPLVNGQGYKRLLEAGIDVDYGCLAQECQSINPIFNKTMRFALPYVSLKIASSLDGKIALKNGESQWITNKEARRDLHHLRSKYQAIAVGINTLIQDNPLLNNREDDKASQPMRIVFDSSGRIPEMSHFIQSRHSERIICTTQKLNKEKKNEILAQNVRIIQTDTDQSDLLFFLQEIYKLGISSILIEGGAAIMSSFLKEDLADTMYLYLSGKILGSNALSWINTPALDQLADAKEFDIVSADLLENNLKITAKKKQRLF